jgi:hypothetical protein
VEKMTSNGSNISLYKSGMRKLIENSNRAERKGVPGN